MPVSAHDVSPSSAPFLNGGPPGAHFACGKGDGTPWWRLNGWRGCCCCAPRYWVVSATTLMGLLTGSIYFGWAALASMMLKSESFSSMCSKDAKGHFIDDGRNARSLAICDAQDAAVQHLYSITLFTMTSVSLAAGGMMDFCGPRTTAILGYCLSILASCCLAASRWGGDVFLYIGFVLLGAATDTAFLPIMSSARLFPSKSGFIICILGSAASASFGVPPLLEFLADTMALKHPLDIFWGYAAAGPGLCLLLTCIFLPNSAFLEGGGEQPEASPQQHYQELVDAAEKETAAPDSEYLVSSDPAVLETQERQPNSAWTYVCSWEYIILAIYFSVVSCAVVFYQEAPSRYFSPQVVRALEIALPLSFIPCAALGWLADIWGIVSVMAIVTANGIMAYACALSGNDWLGYISVFCFMVFIAVYTSQLFVYTEKRFPAVHFGKVIGSIQLIGGSVALICNPVYSAVAVSQVISLEDVTYFIIAFLLTQYIWLLYLWRVQKSEEEALEQQLSDVGVQLQKKLQLEARHTQTEEVSFA
ncbi:protein FMP42 [Cyclospora cayetanensis]|uniref:Uncharacterized protein n=2 Tax=Cyclospora cayetanensis TaxID=88456 RepID=A0A1D3CVR5_9EIME|nr:protein FMP42 [Cyclospora cayetanensis]OEH75292.1 hypothetical protein cyc_01958 [Cyclospora cayetanensis]